jgi:hypothetical protein
MLAQPVACAFDLHDNRVVQQAIQQGCRDHGIPKNLALFGKAAIGGKDHGAFLVAGIREPCVSSSAPRKMDPIQAATGLTQRVASEANLARALLNVIRNKGASGVDGQTVEEALLQSRCLIGVRNI